VVRRADVDCRGVHDHSASYRGFLRPGVRSVQDRTADRV
jgi:hypothetical protein